MKIQIDPHTIHRASERGVTVEEILDVLENGLPVCAKLGRFGKTKVFPFDRLRNGIHYPEKRVEVIYVVESGTIITVSVYSFFGSWTA